MVLGERRSFTLVKVIKKDGCPTKFRPGRYESKTAHGAASKAFSQLCRVKKIRGVCTLIVTVQETTQGSAKKEFTYKFKREKLAKPITLKTKKGSTYKILHKNKGHKFTKTLKGKKCKKSSGRLAKRTSKIRGGYIPRYRNRQLEEE